MCGRVGTDAMGCTHADPARTPRPGPAASTAADGGCAMREIDRCRVNRAPAHILAHRGALFRLGRANRAPAPNVESPGRLFLASVVHDCTVRRRLRPGVLARKLNPTCRRAVEHTAARSLPTHGREFHVHMKRRPAPARPSGRIAVVSASQVSGPCRWQSRCEFHVNMKVAPAACAPAPRVEVRYLPIAGRGSSRAGNHSRGRARGPWPGGRR
jgi:hypothetical protein